MKVTLTFLSMVFGLVVFGLILTMESDAKIETAGAWLLDEADGDKVEDASGNGIDGEIQGKHEYVEGKFGDAMEFNGEDTLVYFDNEDPDQAFALHRDKDVSFMFWVQPFDVTHDGIFWTRGDPKGADADRYNIYSGPGETFGFDYREVGGGIHGLIQGIELPNKKWTHIAVTREGNTYNCYTNGKQVGQAKDPSPKLPEMTSWMISGRPGFIFNGLIDELAFFDSVLSNNDITNIMDNGLEKAALSVEPSAKLATAWARIKTSR
jgi:arabinan endo-1,5-alpha-L-arabinosidase